VNPVIRASRFWLPAALVLATACGAPAAPEQAAPAPQAENPHAHHGPVNDPNAPVSLWAVQTGPLGIVATDGGGRLLYRSDADSATPPTSACTGACTETWTPLLVGVGQQLDLEGVSRDKIGRLARPDGTTQLTLAGWPIYVRPDDDGNLASTGANGADGSWWAVTPAGDKATPA
jgi:predicted lipoprotein with Yx(FWY)xxD motif